MLSNGYISALLFINVITWSKRFLDSFCRFVCGAKLPSKLHKYSIYSMWTTFASHGPFFPLCFTLTLTLSVEVHPHMRKIKSNFYSRFASDDKKFIGEREKIHCGIQSFKVISFAVNSIYIKSYSCTWSKIFNKFNSLFLCLFPLSFFTLSHSKLICYRHITTQITEFPSKLHNGKDYQEINSLNQWHSTTNWFIWELLLFFCTVRSICCEWVCVVCTIDVEVFAGNAENSILRRDFCSMILVCLRCQRIASS